MAKSTLILIRKPPFGSVDSWEALRCSLSFYASNLPVDILLKGDGVYNWIRGIAPESKDPHSVSRLANDVERFDIPVFVVGEDLTERQLSQADLISSYPRVITRQDSAEIICSHETTIAV